MYRPNLKSVALPVTVITAAIQTLGVGLVLDVPFKVIQGRRF